MVRPIYYNGEDGGYGGGAGDGVPVVAQPIRSITLPNGQVICPSGTMPINGNCIPIAFDAPIDNPPLTNDNPIITNPVTTNPVTQNPINLPAIPLEVKTAIDSIIQKAKDNPLIALGIAGLLGYVVFFNKKGGK